MKLSAGRDVLLKPLQAVIGVVERRQTMPILSNVLLVARNGELAVTATDLEVELVARAAVEVETGGEITVSGRKLLDICKALPDDAVVQVAVSGEKMSIRAGRSRFSLATLPAAEFPSIEYIKASQTITVQKNALICFSCRRLLCPNGRTSPPVLWSWPYRSCRFLCPTR
jgi:DNA polymerase-3 subunit beta